MREILYVQAGSLANYVGTHFWNTQESYFTYHDGEEPIVDHDVSFREGLTLQGQPTYSPRLLLFDRRSNFGVLPNPYGDVDEQDEAEQIGSQWNGDVIEYRQQPIPPSSYQTSVEKESNEDGDHDAPESNPHIAELTEVRYWSDYNRVLYHPRTLQRLPDLADWEDSEGEWGSGKDLFHRYNTENDFMEDSFRLYIEECDGLQGLQIMNDTTTFGSFVNSFITLFRDDFAKLSILSIPFLSDSVFQAINTDDTMDIKKTVNDALCLRDFNELATITLPIQSPSTWTPGSWSEGVSFDRKKVYHTSAILSAHIETATLPLRLRGGSDSLASFSSRINGLGDTRFAQLQGVLPVPSPLSNTLDLEQRIYDFSVVPAKAGDETSDHNLTSIFTRMGVTRGLTRNDVNVYDNWAAMLRPSPYSVHSTGYPLPTSFPALFPNLRTASRGILTPARAQNVSVRGLSMLSTGAQTARMFAQYARAVDSCGKQHGGIAARMAVEADELRDLKETMWAIHDTYAGEEGFSSGGVDADMGEDEE